LHYLRLQRSCCFSHCCTPPPPLPTLSLHDALPISDELIADVAVDVRIAGGHRGADEIGSRCVEVTPALGARDLEHEVKNPSWLQDRKSTRLNSSHGSISYAVFCLKKKKKTNNERHK